MPRKTTKKTASKVTRAPQTASNPQLPISPYKERFDGAVRQLEAIRETILHVQTFDELSKADRATRESLLTLVKYAMDLGYWMQESVNQRKKELKEKA